MLSTSPSRRHLLVVLSILFALCWYATATTPRLPVPDDTIGPESTIGPAALTAALQAELRRNTRPRTQAKVKRAAASVAAAAAIAGALWDPAGLPCKNPPVWTDSTDFASGDKVTSWVSPLTNATYVRIVHEPILGVTIQQMVWLHDNLDKVVRHPRRPSELYQLHVLRHPVDNKFFRYNHPRNAANVVYNATDPTEGTAWHFGHFYAAGCTVKRIGHKRSGSISCPPPSFRKSPTCRTSAEEIAGMSSYNETGYYAIYNNASGFSSGIWLSGVAVYKQTFHWKPLPKGRPGIQITETAVFGVDEPFAGQFNRELASRLLGRAVNGNVEVFVAQFMRHDLESFGWLPLWLPNVYRAATANSQSADASADADLP